MWGVFLFCFLFCFFPPKEDMLELEVMGKESTEGA